MKPGLDKGTRGEVVIEVTEDMCPAFDGVVLHRVLSTWSLAHHMELAARKVLAPYLEDHEEGLGSHISVDHLSPTPVGKTVRVVAEATEVDSRRVVCDVRGYDGDRLIARGSQVQHVLPKETILDIIARHK